MATPVAQLDELIASTLSAFEKSGKVQDQIFNGDPLFAFLNAKGAKQTLPDGADIKVNLRYGKNTNTLSYSGDDTLTAAKTQTVGQAIYNWRNYSTAIYVNNDEMLKNRGKSAIVNLWADKTQEAVDSLQDDMTVDIYGDGTGNAGKDILGLGALVSTTGILGGIDRATETWWRAQVKDVTGATVLTTDMVRNMTNTVRGPGGDPQKQGRVDLILMPQNLYEKWESLYEGKIHLDGSDLTLGKLGFDALKYKGAEVTWSPNVPAGTIYFLSSAFMGLRVMEGRDFAFSDVIDGLGNNKDSKKAFILWMGQLVCSNCRRLGKIVNATAA